MKNTFINLITTPGCDLCNRCIKMCHLWKIDIKEKHTHMEQVEDETYPIIYLNGKDKITYEDFCSMIMKGDIGK